MSHSRSWTLSLLVLATLLGTPCHAADGPPRLPERDRVRLAELFRLATAVQDSVWPQWSRAPFAVLLVTPNTEFLIRHPAPSPDFTAGPYDSLLGSPVYSRPRVFPITFQATFPAVGGISTIVIGQPELAEPRQNSTRWILTAMHEHFHQWQESQPGYAADIAKLDLARGDSTGMWMLDFPFPYADSAIAGSFDEMCRLQRAALLARGTPDFAAAYGAADDARRRCFAGMIPDDSRYLRFQLWKEGVARYTEYAVARVAARRYEPTGPYRRLDGYTSFEAEAANVLDGIEREMATMSLAERKRIAVYPAGATAALLLDEVRPGWKRYYTQARFSLGGLFAPR